MKSVLSGRQQTTILICTLIFHAIFLMSMFMMQLHQQDIRNAMIKKEPLITIQEESPVISPSVPEQNWVAVNAMNTAPTPKQLPANDAPLVPASPEIEQQENAPSDASIKQAVDLAQQLLDQAEIEPAKPLPMQPEQQQKPAETTTIEFTSPEIRIERRSVTKTTSSAQKMTFAQLAQGFTNHLEQAAIAVKSNTQGTASIEQLKQLHFCQKIIECIVTAYKINKDSTPHTKTMETTLVRLALNKDGTIHTLAILQSSGNAAIDRFLMNIFKDASSSFPPVPASFAQNPYELPVFHIERLEALQSTNGWYINNHR